MFNCDEKLKIAKIKLQKSQERLRTAEYDYDVLECELESTLEDAQSEIDGAESELEKAEKEYESLLEQLADDKIREPKNAFEKKFYQAARFCRKELSDTRYLNYVKVEKGRIVACNGFAAVIIKCNEVPENLINKLVPWDTIGDVIDFQKSKMEHFDLDKIINDAIQNASQSKTYSKDTLLDITEKIINMKDMETVILNFATSRIGINKKYLDYGMDCFEDTESFIVSWKDEEFPVAFRNHDVTVLILPIRLPK